MIDGLQSFVEQMQRLLQSGQIQEMGVWAYAVFLVLVLFEGSVITFLAGMAAASGWLNPLAVYALAILGNTITDWFWYGLGYLGKVEWLAGNGRVRRLWRRFGGELTLAKMEQIQARVREHAPRILFIAKLTAGFTIASLIASGLVRVSPRRWVPVVLLAESLRSGLIVFLGYHMTRSVSQFESGLAWLILAGGLALLGYILWYLRHRATRWLLG